MSSITENMLGVVEDDLIAFGNLDVFNNNEESQMEEDLFSAEFCATTTTRSSSSSIGNNNSSSSKVAAVKKASKKRKWKKPKDMPKRPLSAYNIFFAHERQQILEKGTSSSSMKTNHHDAESDNSSNNNNKGGEKNGSQQAQQNSVGRAMGFAGLARNVAAKWKSLDSTSRAHFEKKAKVEQERYKKEVEEWKLTQDRRKEQEKLMQQSTVVSAATNNSDSDPKETHLLDIPTTTTNNNGMSMIRNESGHCLATSNEFLNNHFQQASSSSSSSSSVLNGGVLDGTGSAFVGKSLLQPNNCNGGMINNNNNSLLFNIQAQINQVQQQNLDNAVTQNCLPFVALQGVPDIMGVNPNLAMAVLSSANDSSIAAVAGNRDHEPVSHSLRKLISQLDDEDCDFLSSLRKLP